MFRVLSGTTSIISAESTVELFAVVPILVVFVVVVIFV